MPLSWIVLVGVLCVGLLIQARFVYLLARSQTSALERIRDLERERERSDRGVNALIGRVARLEEGREQVPGPMRPEDLYDNDLAALFGRPEEEAEPEPTKPTAPGPTSFERILQDDPEDPV